MALLPDRGVVRVAGDEAEKFLNGCITADLAALSAQAAVHSALLTPQGKMLFEFFVLKAPGRDGAGGFLLETARDQADGLLKRLTIFKLRARVELENASNAWQVAAAWDGAPAAAGDRIVYADPRLPAMGYRVLAPVPPGFTAAVGDVEGNAQWVASEDYHAHRIALGVPEGGKDYVLGETFPHEADLDLLNGVSFTKGCFVGQEVVARMKHRGTVRKRVVPVEGEAPLVSGASVTAGGVEIGRVGSTAGTLGLALIRLDRAAETRARGEPLVAGGIAIGLRQTPWSGELVPGAAAVPGAERR